MISFGQTLVRSMFTFLIFCAISIPIHCVLSFGFSYANSLLHCECIHYLLIWIWKNEILQRCWATKNGNEYKRVEQQKTNFLNKSIVTKSKNRINNFNGRIVILNPDEQWWGWNEDTRGKRTLHQIIWHLNKLAVSLYICSFVSCQRPQKRRNEGIKATLWRFPFIGEYSMCKNTEKPQIKIKIITNSNRK